MFIHKIIKALGWVTGFILLIIGVSLASDYTRKYTNPENHLEHKVDSLSTEILLIQEDKKFQEQRIKDLQKDLSKVDSNINVNHKQVYYEIKKLKTFDAKHALSLSDSITRAEGVR